MIGIEQHMLCDGVHFRSVRDTKFKTFRISVNFLLPLRRETAAANALLPYLLTRASRAYPDFTQMSQKMDALYGANLSGDVGKLGDFQVLTVQASCLSNAYALAGEDLVAEMTSVLCGALFDPALEDGLFRENDFRQEQRQTLEQIDAEFSDKRAWAFNRCVEAMCADEPYGISRFGARADVEKLTREEVTKAWHEMCRTARVEILVLGNCNPKPVIDAFRDAFSSQPRAYQPVQTDATYQPPQTVRRAEDCQDVVQGKLVLGMRLPIARTDDRVPAARLMTSIFGGTPNSKLFLIVREKMSLCYYCSAGYNPMKGLLFVQSGVEFSNMDKAEAAILDQLKAVQAGDFTDEDIQAAKLSMQNNLYTTEDYLGAQESWYLAQTLAGQMFSPTEYAALIGAVTREQIVEAAKDVQLDTVYRLIGKKEEAAQ